MELLILYTAMMRNNYDSMKTCSPHTNITNKIDHNSSKYKKNVHSRYLPPTIYLPRNDTFLMYANIKV